jgi:hypothetical protein
MQDLPPRKERKLFAFVGVPVIDRDRDRQVEDNSKQERRCNAASSKAKILYKSAAHSRLSHADVCMYARNRRVDLLVDWSEKLCHV